MSITWCAIASYEMAIVLILAWRNNFVCVRTNHLSGTPLNNKTRHISRSSGRLNHDNECKCQMIVVVGPKIYFQICSQDNIAYYNEAHSNLNPAVVMDENSVRWHCLFANLFDRLMANSLVHLIANSVSSSSNVRSQHENQCWKDFLSH